MQQQQQTARGRVIRSRQITTPTPESLKPYILGDFSIDGNQVVQQVPQQRKTQQNVRPICPITNETIPRGRLYVADCLHAFDIRAITEWIVVQGHITCPVCRRRTVGFHIDTSSENFVGNRHINSSNHSTGGWVAHTAVVSPDAFIGFHCKVGGNAKVLHHATLKGRAIVLEDAVVKNNARVEGRSVVADHACVSDDVVITGYSMITGHARLGGNASVDNSVIAGRVRIDGRAKIDNRVLRAQETITE